MRKKNKAFAVISIIVVASVFGVLVFSASASDNITTEQEEKTNPFWGFRSGWLDDLTEEQMTTLQEMIEENKAEIEENRAEIEAQLEAWGIEIPTRQCPRSFFDDLTEEQKEELQTMKQDFQNAVNSKLEGWGIEVPEFGSPIRFGMGFHRRGVRGFGLFKP